MNSKERIIKSIRESIQNLKGKGVSDKLIIEEYEKEIIKLNIPALSYYFAKNIGWANIKAHEKVVIESKNPEYNYMFAISIRGADIEAHEALLIASGAESMLKALRASEEYI